MERCLRAGPPRGDNKYASGRKAPPPFPLAVVLPAQHTPAYWCLLPVSPLALARSLARSLSSAANTDTLVPVSPLARPLALRSLAGSPLARSLVLRSLARSLTVTNRLTGVTVRHGMLRARRYNGDIPNKLHTAMPMLPSRPPWYAVAELVHDLVFSRPGTGLTHD